MSELVDKALEAVEIAKNSGKIKRGSNEATKALERGTAKLVVYAKDASPPEIVMHLPLLAKEKNIPCVEVPQKADLGSASGLPVATTAVAIIAEGEAKKVVEEVASLAAKE